MYNPYKTLPKKHVIPKWDSDEEKIRDDDYYLEALEERGVFFSYPMDLDFSMIISFPEAYEIGSDDLIDPKPSDIKSVLGKNRGDSSEYDGDELELFCSYHKLFKIGSKPAAHINALSSLTDKQLLDEMPTEYDDLIDAVIEKLAELPE